MDEAFDPLKCTEDLPASPSCHMDYDDMPELQEVDLDRSSDVYHVGSEVSHHQEEELSSSPRDSGWLTELANIATSPQSPLVKDSAPHKRSSPVHIFGHSNSLHSYARPPLASSAPTPSRGHLRERRRVRASSESESGVFSMSSSFSDDEDMVWSQSWPDTAWHCFLKGTRLRFHRGPNVEWQDADDLRDSDDDSDDEGVTSFSSLKRYGSEGLQLVNREETLSFSQAVLKLTFDPGSPDHGLLTAECRLDHPFFVKNKGWSSFYPSLTVVHHGIPCYEMQVGEVCLPPNHPDAINCDDSVVFDTFRSYDFTPLDSSAVYLLSSMARQRRTSQSSGGAASPDRDGSSPPHASGTSTSNRGHASPSGTTVAAVTPTKCKRPMNAFMLFAKRYRVEYTQLYPGKDNRAISVILGDRWKKMKSEERRMYTLEAKALADQQKKLNPDCWKRKRTNSLFIDDGEPTKSSFKPSSKKSSKNRFSSNYSHCWRKPGTEQDSAEIGCRRDQDQLSLVKEQCLKTELIKRIEHLKRAQLSNSSEMTPELIQLSTIPNFFQYSTGFTFDQFNILCTVFSIPSGANNARARIAPPLIYEKVDRQITAMPLRQQLLLVLMKLRQNFDHKELAFKFNISHRCVSVLFDSWIDFMFTTLGRIPMWPHRDIITQKMPSTYSSEFPTTFAILDCTEIKIQQPTSLPVQSEAFSNYKSTNTLKSLIVVDPRGSVMFCSTLFTGCITDKEIVKKSGIMPLLRNLIMNGYLKQGDGLMADKGFLIDQEVEDVGLKLNIPPCRTPECDVSKTKAVAHHRIHVERAISKIKCFKIVSDIIPNDRLHNINEIWYIVSILSNFQPMIMKG